MISNVSQKKVKEHSNNLILLFFIGIVLYFLYQIESIPQEWMSPFIWGRRIYTVVAIVLGFAIICYALSEILPEIKNAIKWVCKCVFSFNLIPYKSVTTQKYEDYCAREALFEKEKEHQQEKETFIATMSEREKTAYLYGKEDGQKSGFNRGYSRGHSDGYIMGHSSNN